MISSESWDEIEAAFSAGLALGPEEREQPLRAADPALAGEVRRLWGNWANASGFLASPAVSFEGIPLLVSGQEVLGRFVVIDRLGVGGMSEVYRARDTVLGRLVALKLMQRDLGGNRERLEHEARAISSLSHPNIRSLYDLGWEENLPILVMEHLEGETLAQRLERGPISLADVLSYAVEILKALEHAHAKGIVHRDVKPGNIFLTDSGAKLLDFGIATSQESPAMAAEIAGSPGYMSPEQLNGESLDARSDIYSFGRVLEQMIESRERSVRSRLEFVAHRCVAKEPVERFQSAAALRQALEEIATKTSQSRFLDRRSVAIILAMAIGVAGLGWWSWKRSRESSQGPHYGVPIRLTVEGGLAQDAVISPDGKTVAFASDRSGNFDIYVQDIATGQATQLTNSPFDEKRPSFSPDGNNIVFQSSELGAGISVVPARGGSIRHVVANGYDPRVSPDGRRIAYWTSPSDDSTIGTSAKMYIVDFRGGPPTHLAVNFITGGNPIWSEDGQYLIFSGIALNKLRDWHYIRLKDMKTGSVHALSMLDNIGKTGALIRASFCYEGPYMDRHTSARPGTWCRCPYVRVGPLMLPERKSSIRALQKLKPFRTHATDRLLLRVRYLTKIFIDSV
ncbi:MAG TPA: protein kinase [Bryobacteraceae bacterium]